MNLPESVISALRDNDQDRFGTELNSLTTEQLTATNTIRFASWFSGVGLSLLQLTSFARPKLAPLVLSRDVAVDLHSACALGDAAAVRTLLSKQPTAIEAQLDSYYPIQFALGHPECLRCLLESGDNPSRTVQKLAWFEWEDRAAELKLSSWQPMHMVALGRGDRPHSESVRTLLEFGADPTATSSPFGEAPIHLSAIYDQTDLIRCFVDIGCDVDSRTREGVGLTETKELFDPKPFGPFAATHQKTPLMIAVGEGHANAAKTLLQLGADPNATDSHGYTPLHYAAHPFWQENVEIVQLLTSNGGAPLAKCSSGERPADLANARGYAATQRTLQHPA